MLQLPNIAVHHTCMPRESLTSTQVFLDSQHPTNMTLILPNPCLKTNWEESNFSLLINAHEYGSFYYILFGCLSSLGLFHSTSQLPSYLERALSKIYKWRSRVLISSKYDTAVL